MTSPRGLLPLLLTQGIAQRGTVGFQQRLTRRDGGGGGVQFLKGGLVAGQLPGARAVMKRP